MSLVESKYSGRFLPEVIPGDAVNEDDTLCRISVWGIKLGIRCPCDGTVKTIFPVPGADVRRGDPLFDITAPPPAGVTVAGAASSGATVADALPTADSKSPGT